MPVYEGAAELTRAIRKVGAEVWLCTTRPYLKMDTQAPNTMHWLRRNKIQYDHMLAGPHKYRDLVRNVNPNRIVLVADDLPEMVDQSLGRCLPSVLRDQPYNRHYKPGPYSAPDWRGRVMDMAELEVLAINEIGKWKENHGTNQ